MSEEPCIPPPLSIILWKPSMFLQMAIHLSLQGPFSMTWKTRPLFSPVHKCAHHISPDMPTVNGLILEILECYTTGRCTFVASYEYWPLAKTFPVVIFSCQKCKQPNMKSHYRSCYISSTDDKNWPTLYIQQRAASTGSISEGQTRHKRQPQVCCSPIKQGWDLFLIQKGRRQGKGKQHDSPFPLLYLAMLHCL